MHFDVSFQVSDMALPADFGKVQTASDGGYERGYADGYGKGETAAKAEAEAHNEEILTDCNAVLPTKGVETADTLEQVPQRIREIQSYSEGYNVGVEDGKQAEHDAFWDVYQINGTRRDYSCAFSGAGWTAETFKPKYDIIVSDAYMMFRYCNFQYGTEYDLAQQLEDCGVVLDTSKCFSFTYMFLNARFDRVPPLDCRGCSSLGSMFYYSQVRKIEKLILREDGTQTFSGCFQNHSYLESIDFDGVIGTDISFAHSNLLDDASVQSIIDHLKDLTGATAQTLTLHKDVGNKLTEAQKATITAKNWTLVY